MAIIASKIININSLMLPSKLPRGKFQSYIGLPFISTHVILKYISIVDLDPEGSTFVYHLRSSLVTSSPLFAYSTFSMSQATALNLLLDLKFPLYSGFINGTYDFELVSLFEEASINLETFKTSISIILEFTQEV